MKLSEELFVIGAMVLLCSYVGGNSLRKRRQSDFVFPDEFNNFQNRGGFGGSGFGGGQFGGGGFGGGFQNQFPNGFVNQFQQQGPQQRPQPSDGFFPSQSRVPFPTPIEPGPPANINTSPQESATVVPDMVLTTPSPSFLACMNNCPTTSEYNPICGTNRQLYFNQQKFDCALRCGAQVRVWRRGSCEGLFNMMRG